MNISMKFSGGKEIDDALAALADPKAMRAAANAMLTDAAKPIYDDAKLNVRSRTGRTKAFVADALKIVLDNSEELPTVAITIVDKGGKNSRSFVARFLELGTIFMAPRPWLRPAFDMNVNTALKRLADNAFKYIEATAKRYGKK